MSSETDWQALPGRVVALLESLPESRAPVWVMLPFDIPDEQLMALLCLDGLAGCLLRGDLPRSGEALKRVGHFDGKGSWRFPATVARTLVCVGQSQDIRPRLLFDAMRRGVRHVIVMDAFCTWRCRLIPVWYAGYLYRRLADWIGISSQGRRVRYSRLWGCLQLGVLRRRWRELQATDGGARATQHEPVAGRVVLICDSLAPGGAERQVVYTALGLKERDQEPFVVCRQGGSDYLDFYRPALAGSVPVHTLRPLAKRWLAVSDPVQDADIRRLSVASVRGLLSALPRHLVDEILALALYLFHFRPQVVHCWQDHMNVVGGLAAAIAGVPQIVLSTHNMAPFRLAYNQPFLVPANRFLLGLDNVRMFNNSAAGARDYAAWLGLMPADIHVVRNGFAGLPQPEDIPDPVAARVSFDIPADAVVMGGVFRFYEEKRPLLWLEAAALVGRQRPDVYFLIAGDGPLRGEMEARAEQLGIAGQLRMPGQVGDIYRALRSMDVLVLSSRMEGLPNVLIEAQAVGCPVVSTDVGGCAEAIDEGVSGWLAASTAEALASRITAAISDPAWRCRAAQRGPELVGERFSGGRMLADTLAVYHDSTVTG